jgi:Rap1a immunity proteins
MLRIPRWATLLAAFCMVALAGTAASGTTTGQLLKKCQAPRKSEDYRLCMVYLSGIRDAYLFERNLKNDRIRLLCAPGSLSVPQVRQAYLQYMREHRSYLNYEAASYVYISLMKAFPCRK